jgi:predicted ATPase/class 3 adenylate cyclase
MREFATDENVLLQALVPGALLQPLREGQPEALEEVCGLLRSTLDTLIPFIPAPALGLQLARPGRISGQYLSGSVLLADLSGFNTLTSHLASLGRQGNEVLGGVVNRLFTGLLEDLHAHGGGLIKFGGDGLTAFFDAAHLGAQHATHACAAALAMQQRMNDFAALDTPTGMFEVGLRVAVQSGRIFAVEVGDSGHIELVVTGRAINRVVAALDAASPGEVIVSDDTLKHLNQPQVLQKLSGLHILRRVRAPSAPASPQPLWRPGPADLQTVRALLQRIAVLRPYLPYGLPSRYIGSAAEGEFRPVLVLFANFYAFSRFLSRLELWTSLEQDTTIIGQIINTYFTRTQDVIHHYGGSMNKVDMATFGDRMMALFGAPLAQEDSAARAVRAAMDLDQVISQTNQEVADLLREWTDAHPDQRSLLQVVNVAMRPRIGIAAGPVFAGLVGTRQRHEYTVMGASVHLAARLMASADSGDVLLTSHARRAVGAALEAEQLPPVILKGIEKSVPVFRAVRWNAAQTTSHTLARQTPFQGREHERRLLRELAPVALGGGEAGGRIVLITGEAGLGKSRLIQEILAELRVEIDDLQICRASAQLYEQSTPYALIATLLAQLVKPPRAGTPEEQAAWVQQLMDERVPSWGRFAPLLSPLLNLPLPETPLLQQLTPEQRHDRLHDLIVQFLLETARGQPLICVADDLHWADASSMAVLGQLGTMLPGAPLLLLLASRRTIEHPEEWQADRLTVLELGDLSLLESESLVGALLDGALPDDVRALIARNGGTPLFIEESLRYLIDTGALARTFFGSWRFTRSPEQISVPMQIEQMITARLDRLDDETHALIQVAAVIGPRFEVRLLEALTPQQRGREQRLADLVTAALLVPENGASQATYSFRNAITHEVIYNSILFARRTELHGQIAAAIERVYSTDLDPQRILLAQHYLRAQQYDAAFPHLLQAAQAAQARHANAEAIALYEQARAAAPWEQREAPINFALAAALYEGQGDVLALTGNDTTARQNYEVLLRMISQYGHDEPVAQARLNRKISTTYDHQGMLEVALDWLGRTEAVITAAPSSPALVLEHIRVLSDIGWVRFRQGRLEEAQQLLEQALALLDTNDSWSDSARIFNRLGGVAFLRGDMALAQQYVERSLAASLQSGDLVGQANALNNLGNLAGTLGRFDDAIQYGLQSIEINERIGNWRGLATAANNVGCSFLDNDEYDAALAYFKQAISYAQEIRDTFQQMHASLNCGRALIGMGRWDDAERTLQQSQFIALQLRLVPSQIDALVGMGELAMQRGDLENALQIAEECRGMLTDLEDVVYGRFQRLEARIALATGDRERAVRLLQENIEFFERNNNLPEVGRTNRLLSSVTLA